MTDNKSSVERCYLHLWWFYCFCSFRFLLCFFFIVCLFNLCCYFLVFCVCFQTVAAKLYSESAIISWSFIVTLCLFVWLLIYFKVGIIFWSSVLVCCETLSPSKAVVISLMLLFVDVVFSHFCWCYCLLFVLFNQLKCHLANAQSLFV